MSFGRLSVTFPIFMGQCCGCLPEVQLCILARWRLLGFGCLDLITYQRKSQSDVRRLSSQPLPCAVSARKHQTDRFCYNDNALFVVCAGFNPILFVEKTLLWIIQLVVNLPTPKRPTLKESKSGEADAIGGEDSCLHPHTTSRRPLTSSFIIVPRLLKLHALKDYHRRERYIVFSTITLQLSQHKQFSTEGGQDTDAINAHILQVIKSNLHVSILLCLIYITINMVTGYTQTKKQKTNTNGRQRIVLVSVPNHNVERWHN